MTKVGRIAMHFEKLRESDKIKHFWVCFSLQCFFLLWLPMLFSVCVTLLIGILKECWDQYYGSGFCWYDMAANILGVCASAILFIVAQIQIVVLT